ncbi:sulfite exporter TauE/SafE family protein [Anaerolineae bacterium CFX7]|nr:sulfite exporter TauE/SafE family protein [Anaerolineae bacterium CFX7]
MDTLHYYIFGVMLLAALTQTLSGFGSSLVAMALLPIWLELRQAVPLVALVSLTLEIILLIYYRDAINLRAMRRVIFGSLFGIPLGILFLRNVDAAIVLRLLGFILLGYAAYALLRLRVPNLTKPLWGWVFGFVAGILGGAYNTSGPPVVIYGQSQNWPPNAFKANLQSFFLVNSAIVLSGHGLSGNVTAQTLNYFLFALPAAALGVFVGLKLNRYIDPLRFRQIVQLLLMVLGARLILA